ncbi:MAG: hypothetical protein BRC47_03200 [Cyanobacteria bacterium QS_7_48_42]|nr:MAG: hypothetical protein BRC47_03200 [Cyanobacteria bacterium QS_7_48_42]
MGLAVSVSAAFLPEQPRCSQRDNRTPGGTCGERIGSFSTLRGALRKGVLWFFFRVWGVAVFLGRGTADIGSL